MDEGLKSSYETPSLDYLVYVLELFFGRDEN